MPRQPKLGKQKNGKYVYWGAIIGGERVRFGRVDEVEWATAHRAFIDRLAAIEKPKVVASRMSVETLCLEHCKWHKEHHDKKTTANRLLFLDKWCSHLYAGQPIGLLLSTTVGKEHLADFMRQFKDGWTAWNYCVAIKATFNWAMREGKITTNPLAKYPNPPQPKADVTESTLITPEEVEWFLVKAEPYGAGDILRVLYLTGARPGELCSAVGSDYITSSKQLRLLTWKNGKKTNTARRIPLSVEAVKIVGRLAKVKSATIFSGPDGAAWTPNRLQKIWRKIRDGKWRDRGEQLSKVDSEKRIKETAKREILTPYSLRHLWISDALQQGIPIATIAKMAGTSIKMIEQTYGHFRTSDLNEIANRIASKRAKI